MTSFYFKLPDKAYSLCCRIRIYINNMNASEAPITMNATLAKNLLNMGGVLIIAGVPVGTEFGIDLCCYAVGKNFRGVKMLPPGLHYVWCASKGPYGDTAPRVGFVHFFRAGEIVVREWDRDNEELRERQIADRELEKQRIRDNLYEMDKFLAPYDYRYSSKWRHLTDTVTQATMERCQPALRILRTNVELQSCPDTERPRGKLQVLAAREVKMVVDEDDLLPKLKPIDGTAPRFTTLPERVPRHLEPEDVSRHCMDCIAAVNTLLDMFSSAQQLMEEVQLAFIFYLVGHSVESLAQWRKILNLLARSEMAVEKYKLLYMKYSEILAHQLPHLPEELMAPGDRNTVYKDVRTMLTNLSLNGLNVSAEMLSVKLKNSLGWEFFGLLDDDPEDLPVFVETE